MCKHKRNLYISFGPTYHLIPSYYFEINVTSCAVNKLRNDGNCGAKRSCVLGSGPLDAAFWF